MKIIFLLLMVSTTANAKIYKYMDCIGKPLENYLHPPKGIVRMKIRDNFVTYEYRYTNGLYCIQMVKFNTHKIITNYYEQGVCGEEADKFSHALFQDPS